MRRVYSVPEIRGLPEAAAWLERKASALSGVNNAYCHWSTGRLIVDWRKGAKDGLKVRSLLEGFSLREAYGTGPRPLLPPRKGRPWHAKSVQETARLLQAHPRKGISQEEARRRRARWGPNLIARIPARSPGEILLKQVQEPASALLGASAAVSAATGALAESAAILGVIGMNGGIGFLTENQSERSLESLSALSKGEALVVRGGRKRKVPVEELVPGDLIAVETGSSVPADARIVRAENLTADESILTGESFPVAKSPSAAPLRSRISARSSLLHKGSLVLSGRAEALVVATGTRTQAGRIQHLLGGRQESELQRRIQRLNGTLIDLSLSSTGLLFALGFLSGQPWLKLVKTSISMAVAAIPEGLPTVSTWTHSRAVSRLLEKGVLVRDLPALEALGRIHTLCLDKTGTITENRMRLERIALPAREDSLAFPGKKGPDLLALMECAYLCNDAGKESGSSSPTEEALRDAALKYPLPRRWRWRLSTEYREGKRRHMETVHRAGRKTVRLRKGDPEEVLSRCTAFLENGKVRPLGRKELQRIRRQNQELSGLALRVLGFARQEEGGPWVWLGHCGLKDPARPRLKEAVAGLHRAGIRTVMITGDQAATAEALARELGLAGEGALLTADMKNGCPPFSELVELARKTSVFARVAPEDKRCIVEALKAGGQAVGMVGDGINDAPALRAAHVGIAVGKESAGVAREVASVVLLREELESLLEAVALGRMAQSSLRKSVHYLLSTNVSEMAVLLAEVSLRLRETMDPLQLLWINLVNDTVPALALAMKKPRRSLLKRVPKREEELLTSPELLRIGKEAALFSVLVMASLLYGHLRRLGPRKGQSLALNTLAISQALHALSCYSRKRISLREIYRSDKPLLLATGLSLTLHFSLLLQPAARRLFQLGRLGGRDLALASLIPVAGFLAVEAAKQGKRPHS